MHLIQDFREYLGNASANLEMSECIKATFFCFSVISNILVKVHANITKICQH